MHLSLAPRMPLWGGYQHILWAHTFWTVGGALWGREPSALGIKHSGCRFRSRHAQVAWTTHLLLGLKMFTCKGGITVSHHPVNPKGNQPWIFIGRTDAEAKVPIHWPPDAKSWLVGKDPDAGKDWRQEEKGAAENEIVRWHHRLNGHEFEQTLGDSEGQGSLACCNPWGYEESDMAEQLNNIQCCEILWLKKMDNCFFFSLGCAAQHVRSY